MADIHWINKKGGSWQTGANWNTGAVPASTDNVALDANGTYTITTTAAETVNSLQVISTVTLDIVDTSFAMTNGTGTGANAGTIIDDNNSTLFLGGIVDNTGTIRENSTGNTTDIRLSYPLVTLTGGGHLNMSNNINNRIYGSGSGYKLTNVDNKISGAGQLGAAQMTLVNETKGVINANQTTQLILNTPNVVTNAGLIEDTGTGGLLVQTTNVDNAGGTISASGKGSHVDLSNSTIQGGILSSAAGGVIQTAGGNGGLDGLTFGVLTLKGNLLLSNNTALFVAGTIDNMGQINESATVNTTDFRLSSQLVTLQGGGAVTLSNSDDNRIYGDSAYFQLVNVDNTISGTGQLGTAQMALVNEKGGIIDANNRAISGVSSGVLTIDCSNGVTNAGLIEDTNTAGLAIVNTLVNNIGGTLQAVGASAHLDLNNATIEGGKLTTAKGGLINNVNGGVLDGAEIGIGAVTNAGTLDVQNNTALTIEGTINNTGTIQDNSIGNNTDIRLATSIVTLQGGGNLIMSDDAANRIYGNSGIYQLDNVDNTISGAGQLGTAQMQLSNSGTIDANGTNALLVNCGVYDATNNAGGLMEATGAGGLALQSGIFANNGTLAANGSSLIFQASAFNINNNDGTLTGGTWDASGGGTLAITGGAVAVDSATITLSGANSLFEDGDGNTFTTLGASLTTITAGAQLNILSNASLGVTTGSIANAGIVKLGGNGTLAVGNLVLGSKGLLTGNGTEQGSVTDNTMVVATGGTLDITRNLTGTGVLQIASHAAADVGANLTVKDVTYESGGSETLGLATPGSTTSTISGFANTDVIDLIKTAATSLSYSGNATNGVLTVKNGSQAVATFNFLGKYTTGNFVLAPDGSSGTKITGTGLGQLVFLGEQRASGNHGILAGVNIAWAGDFIPREIAAFSQMDTMALAPVRGVSDNAHETLPNLLLGQTTTFNTTGFHLHMSVA